MVNKFIIILLILFFIFSTVYGGGLYMRKKEIIELLKTKMSGLSITEKAMLLAIVEQESNFNPTAQQINASENSYGLFQFNLINPPIHNLDTNLFIYNLDYQIEQGLKLFVIYKNKYPLMDIPHIWNVGETK